MLTPCLLLLVSSIGSGACNLFRLLPISLLALTKPLIKSLILLYLLDKLSPPSKEEAHPSLNVPSLFTMLSTVNVSAGFWVKEGSLNDMVPGILVSCVAGGCACCAAGWVVSVSLI